MNEYTKKDERKVQRSKVLVLFFGNQWYFVLVDFFFSNNVLLYRNDNFL